jgi:hypothetical protein
MRPSAQVNGFTFQDKRLDARYDWLPYVFLAFQSSSCSPLTLSYATDRAYTSSPSFCVWAAGDQELEIAYFGDGCGGQPAQNVSGALSMLTPHGTAYAHLTIDTRA